MDSFGSVASDTATTAIGYMMQLVGPIFAIFALVCSIGVFMAIVMYIIHSLK